MISHAVNGLANAVGPLVAWSVLVFVGSVSHGSAACGQSDQDRVAPEIILVVGAGGTPEFAEQFGQWADRWAEVAEKSKARLTRIGQSDSDTSDRDQLEKAVATITGQGDPPLWIVLVGHGTFSQGVAKFNLRGRDVSAADLAKWLEPVKRTLVIIDCASSSGPFINRLSGPGRVVVTATKSGTQQNFSRFGKYFAEAIASVDSDLDHDDEVSVHEAFLRASAAVKQFYESEARIATEHALIDDNGDGKGTPAKMFRGSRVIAKAKDASEVDGKFARRITLSPTENRLPFTAEELAQRAEIETQLEQLRQKKATLSEEDYADALEPLMIRQAMLYAVAERRAAEE